MATSALARKQEVTDELLLADARPSPAGDGRLEQIATYAQKLRDLDREITTTEATLKDLKAQKEQIATGDLPDLMSACGFNSFKLTDNTEIEVKQVVAGSIPKEDKVKRKAAFDWLRQHKFDAIIKTSISVELPKGQQVMSKRIQDGLKKLGVEVNVQDSVHASTLAAWARDCLRQGIQFPMETLGIFVGNRATIKQSR